MSSLPSLPTPPFPPLDDVLNRPAVVITLTLTIINVATTTITIIDNDTITNNGTTVINTNEQQPTSVEQQHD